MTVQALIIQVIGARKTRGVPLTCAKMEALFPGICKMGVSVTVQALVIQATCVPRRTLITVVR